MKTALIILFCLPVVYLISVLIYGSVTRYYPPEWENLDRINARPPFMIPDTSFSIITWNIGYSGLGEESDFFYDGGKQVRPSEDVLIKNLEGITSELETFNTDFICLQEVDIDSKRSYNKNILKSIGEKLPAHEYTFAQNYYTNFVPLPLFKPLGKVNSGLAIFSKLPSTFPERHSYESNGKWPNKLFMLSRCFSKIHIPHSSGKDIIIINTHNSAYDSTGEMKKVEFEKLLPYIEELYSKGHFVVVAGDWNKCPPDYKTKGQEKKFRETKFTKEFFPENWKLACELNTPTNRKLNQVYSSKDSYTSVIDFFLVSPNVDVDQVETINQNFKFSDHHPVKLNFSLNLKSENTALK